MTSSRPATLGVYSQSVIHNSGARYGAISKGLHWLVFLAILNQFVVAVAMLNTPDWDTTMGFTQGALYEWHKTIGLVALFLALTRYVWRKTTPLPEWAPNLSEGEKRAIHAIERTLYVCMLLAPLSGFVFVTTGGFPIKLFNMWELPRTVTNHTLSFVAQWTHAGTASLLLLTLLAHWGVGLRHHRKHGDHYLQRMLPFTDQQ